jgi:hypothetical protein
MGESRRREAVDGSGNVGDVGRSAVREPVVDRSAGRRARAGCRERDGRHGKRTESRSATK